jgi:hypothetical protein
MSLERCEWLATAQLAQGKVVLVISGPWDRPYVVRRGIVETAQFVCDTKPESGADRNG